MQIPMKKRQEVIKFSSSVDSEVVYQLAFSQLSKALEECYY